MKSIFDQYTALNEGTLSKSQFLRNVKMALPKFINNMTSFDDAVTILKNKGIITEAEVQESMGERLADETYDELRNMLSLGELTQEQYNNIDDYLNDNNELFDTGEFYDPLEVIEYASKQLQINVPLNEAKTENHYCDPQQYNLGMRYELGKGTDREKAHKIVYKNLGKKPSYYTDLFLAGYNEEAMKIYDNRDGSDLDTEVKKDNFLDKKNQMKKIKLDKLTEDEMVVLVGRILNETVDQKKKVNESLLDNMKAKAKELADLYYNGEVADERNYLYNYIKNALKKGDLSDQDKAELEAEWAKLNPPSKPSTTSPGPESVEQYRLGQRGNYTGD